MLCIPTDMWVQVASTAWCRCIASVMLAPELAICTCMLRVVACLTLCEIRPARLSYSAPLTAAGPFCCTHAYVPPWTALCACPVHPQEQLAAHTQPVVLVIDGLDQAARAGAGGGAAESTWTGAGLGAAAVDQAAGASDGAVKGAWAGAAGKAGAEGDEAGLGGSGGGAAAVGPNPLLIVVKKLSAHLPPVSWLVGLQGESRLRGIMDTRSCACNAT